MKIFRLSLFNLKKNKREAAAIVFLTFVTAFLMATFAVSITQISSAFDRCFEETGFADFILLFDDDKYRDIYRDILEEEYNVADVRESRVLVGIGASLISKKGESTGYNIIFADESTERKIEKFKKLNALPDNEIEKLPHPIWLPQYFEITAGLGYTKGLEMRQKVCTQGKKWKTIPSPTVYRKAGTSFRGQNSSYITKNGPLRTMKARSTGS